MTAFLSEGEGEELGKARWDDVGGVTARFYREGSWATWSDSLQSAE